MELIDGKKIAADIYAELKTKIADLPQLPELHIIAATNDESALKYAELKAGKAMELGIDAIVHRFDESVTADEIIHQIEILTQSEQPTGIMVQLTLYKNLAAEKNKILNAVPANTDIDGLSFAQQGLLAQGLDNVILPATVAAIWECLLSNTNNDTEFLRGKHAVIVNHSTLVGRPLAQLLLHHGLTVTVAHEHTQNLSDITRQADILVSATGQVDLITAEYVKDNAIIVDVTSKRIQTTAENGEVKFVTRGDVMVSPELDHKISARTPVPGGVGPVTVACLLRNLIEFVK